MNPAQTKEVPVAVPPINIDAAEVDMQKEVAKSSSQITGQNLPQEAVGAHTLPPNSHIKPGISSNPLDIIAASDEKPEVPDADLHLPNSMAGEDDKNPLKEWLKKLSHVFNVGYKTDGKAKGSEALSLKKDMTVKAGVPLSLDNKTTLPKAA